ncbi:MAG TPA: MoaD/ThiS family protein [Planctomycetota bacterium]|jgi:molybdopterin converting factor subunit 1|nr:MoaD/ThiS family protein [Planctomycetota bacterium]
MRVLLFAGLAEALGRRELPWPDVPLPGNVRELEAVLRAHEPRLAEARFRVAVNQRYAGSDDVVRAEDEIALIPPVSGG